MIENFSIVLGIISAELISLFILYLFGCKMKGKYWYTLYFILSFILLFSIACIFYLNFNPLDRDTLKQSQATDLIYIFSGVSTFLAPLVILFTLNDWKDERQFDKKMEIYEQILTDCEKLNSPYKIKGYYSADILACKVNEIKNSFEENSLIKNNNFTAGELEHHIIDFNNSYIYHGDIIYIFEIYQNILNKITILEAIKSHKELSSEISTILSLINEKRIQYAEFINFFKKFNSKEIPYETFKTEILNQNIFKDEYNNYISILKSIQKTRQIVRKNIMNMMN